MQVVAGIEVGEVAADRATLAGRIASFKDDDNAWQGPRHMFLQERELQPDLLQLLLVIILVELLGVGVAARRNRCLPDRLGQFGVVQIEFRGLLVHRKSPCRRPPCYEARR